MYNVLSLFRAANFKQRVYKNKKCQRYFSKKIRFFLNALFFHLKTRYLRSFHPKNNFKQLGGSMDAGKFIRYLFGKLGQLCADFF